MHEDVLCDYEDRRFGVVSNEEFQKFFNLLFPIRSKAGHSWRRKVEKASLSNPLYLRRRAVVLRFLAIPRIATTEVAAPSAIWGLHFMQGTAGLWASSSASPAVFQVH
jgi:hypothetical protein